MFNIHAIIILIRSIFHALDKYKIHQIQSRVLLKISVTSIHRLIGKVYHTYTFLVICKHHTDQTSNAYSYSLYLCRSMQWFARREQLTIQVGISSHCKSTIPLTKATRNHSLMRHERNCGCDMTTAYHIWLWTLLTCGQSVFCFY